MIFENKTRSDQSYKKSNETTYSFLDRTSTNGYEEVRNDINNFISQYQQGLPKEKLISNLKRGNFEEAFFELFLFNFFTKKKFEVLPEPEIDGLTPDFLIKTDDDSFIVEATTLNHPEWMVKSSNIRDPLIDYINDNVFSDYFLLSIDFIDEPLNSKQKEIANFLKKHLEQESKNYESLKINNETKIITYKSEDNKLRIEFELIPKNFPKKNDRIMLMNGMLTGFPNSDGRLINYLNKKIKKYKKLNKKLILAVNCLQNVDDIDRNNALFGTEVTNFILNSDYKQTYYNQRKNDGLWSGNKNDFNCCLMFFDRLCIDNYKENDPKIIYHPSVKNNFLKF